MTIITNQSTVAIIPARGGSKSIPLKNIKLLNGKPLIYYVIQAAADCKGIDAVFVSTDSEDIKTTVARMEFSNVHVIGRSPQSATDTSSSEEVLLEFAAQHDFEHLVMIQATSPLLTSAQLTEAVTRYHAAYQEDKADSMLSVVRQKRFIWNDVDGLSIPINYNPLDRPRRQDFDGYLVENGAFYITNRESLKGSGCRISGKTLYYEMPEESYFELDEPSDWNIIEGILKRSQTSHISPNEEKLKKLKLLALDCDGVLTDAGMYYSEDGVEIKKFNTKDGMGIGMIQKAGLHVAIITGEHTQIVMNRARKLDIEEVYLYKFN